MENLIISYDYHKIYASQLNKLSGYDINLNGEIINNLPLNSEGLICLSNFNINENVVSINGGETSSTIIPECSFGGNVLLFRKCLSNVNIVLDSNLDILDNCLSVIPEETFLVSYPCFFSKSSMVFGKFSSERNLSLFWKKDMLSFSDNFGSISHNREDSGFCKLRKIILHDFFNSYSCSKQFHNLPNHDSCSFKDWDSITDFCIRNNKFIDVNFHNLKYDEELFKSFSLQLILDVYFDCSFGAFYSSVITHTYYSIFYSARAYLVFKGIKIPEQGQHQAVYYKFKRFVEEGVMEKELLEIYEDAKIKAEVLLGIFENEKDKRSSFTYKTLAQANVEPAKESIENTIIFLSSIKGVLEND